MPHIFISYAKKETRVLAVALADALMCIPGLTAWMDRALRPGQYWTTEIMTQIDNCSYFVVLLSPDVNRPITPQQDRSYVLNELDYVKQLEDKKPVLPVIVIKTKRPVQIAGLQFIDVTDTPTDPARIVAHVCEHFGLPVVVRETAESPRYKRTPTVAEKAEMERLCDQGWVKHERRDYAGALLDLDGAIRLNPTSPLALWRRASVNMSLEDYSAVIADLDVLLRLSPHHVLALSTRGEAKLQRLDYDGAMADFDAALRLDPQSVLAMGSRGAVKMGLGDYAGAFTDFDAALEIDPEWAWAKTSRNLALKKLGFRV